MKFHCKHFCTCQLFKLTVNCSTLFPRLFSGASKPAEEFSTVGYGHALALLLFNTAFPGDKRFLCDDLLIIQTVKIRYLMKPRRVKSEIGWLNVKRSYQRLKKQSTCKTFRWMHQTQIAKGGWVGHRIIMCYSRRASNCRLLSKKRLTNILKYRYTIVREELWG